MYFSDNFNSVFVKQTQIIDPSHQSIDITDNVERGVPFKLVHVSVLDVLQACGDIRLSVLDNCYRPLVCSFNSDVFPVAQVDQCLSLFPRYVQMN